MWVVRSVRATWKLNYGKAQNALNAWGEFVTLQRLPEPMRDNVRHRATVEDALISEERIQELLGEAGFVNIEKIYQSKL